jgi:MarR family 2-MHQ and catechol resistance regulon transcriptional repressor
MGTAEDLEVAGALEAFLQRVFCSRADTDLDSMAGMDLSMTQFRCLVTLALEGDAIPIHQLAEQVHATLPTAGRAIDRLVAQGLVIRREDPHDRRVRRIFLSAEGRQVVSGIDKARRDDLLAFVCSLSPADRSRLLAALLPIVNPTSTSQSRVREQSA